MIDRYDLAIILGIMLVVAGIWLIYYPAALIVGGILLATASAAKDYARGGG
jgi:hypothetical protein